MTLKADFISVQAEVRADFMNHSLEQNPRKYFKSRYHLKIVILFEKKQTQ
jgi:hypothetical protein